MIRRQVACAPIAFVPSFPAPVGRSRAARGHVGHAWRERLASFASLASFACVLAVGACGGDDSNAGTMVTDAGAMKSDGGANGGTGGQSQSIPRRDAQVAEDPIVACDIEAPKCPAGEVCDVLLRRAAGETDFTLELGCVKAGRERAEGDPCDLDPSDDSEPYTVPGLKDTIYREPCGPGLTCAPSSQTRGGFTCQRFCSGAVPCADAASLCLDGPILPYCYKSDGCDPLKQTGCRSGDACYLVPSDDSKQLLSVCAPPAKTATPDGMMGCSINSCNPGSVCLGSVRMALTSSSWEPPTNRMCRRLCTGAGGTAPATSDEDAGVPSGLCTASTMCQPFGASGLLLTSISVPPYGQCE